MYSPKGQTSLVGYQDSRIAEEISHSGTPYGLENEDDDSDGGLIEYWRIIRRNSRSIITTALAGLTLGFLIGVPMKPVFRAKTSLEVLTINEDFMNMKQANPTTTSDYNSDISEEATQASLLESSSLLSRVTEKLGGTPHPTGQFQVSSGGWRKWMHLPSLAGASTRDSLLSSAAASLKVRPTARTRLLEVTIDSSDPRLAMDFANTLTQEFMSQNMEARWNTTQRTSEWLRRELEDARDKLRHSEDALQTYARGSGLIFTDESTNVATEKLQQVQQALSAATSDRIGKQSRFELAQNSPSDQLADVLNDPALRETQSKITDLKRQIADLSAVFNPEYIKIQRLNAELESLQSSFDRSRILILGMITTDYEGALRKEKLLAAAYDLQAHEVSGQDEKAIQYNILKRDVDSNRQLYDTMLQQMKQASIASAMRASNVRVVDPAELPSKPVSPNFLLNSAVGFLSGMFLSVALVGIKERADRTVHQPGDIKTWLELLELGTIPSASIETRGHRIKRGDPQLIATGRLSAHDTATNPYSRNQGDTGAVELITFQKKPSLIAEAFRSTLTSILFVGENGNRPRVLVFTSANPADGKTTVASNVAIAAAEIRCRVLVIDADLRRPRMHNVFDVSNEHGLTDVLQGNLDESMLKGLIKKTSVPDLHVLPAGPATQAVAHLLYSPNFASLLSKFREEYDMILIDTPPMLQMTDARVVGRIADAVILVARSGQTTRDALSAARERLHEDRTRILGTVLNDWNPKRAPRGYYGYYRGDYGGDYYQRPARKT
jgi:capsular exopolysaccharide synthesis family protein